MPDGFAGLLKKKALEIEHILQGFLPPETGFQKTVVEAMNYSLMAGGKRIRPLMMQESFRMLGGAEMETLHAYMAALEMIHTYSLVHDDLPAMDNDTYRRGRKTTHAVYGPGMATLAGDGLLNFAFETAATTLQGDKEEMRRSARAFQVLAGKAGIYGMVGGQCADLNAEGKREASEEELLFIHEHKTAAMMESALMIGAILAGADQRTALSLEQIGSKIGLAFQIRDDILDVTGDAGKLGKDAGQDEKNDKTTYVSLHGLDSSKEEVVRLSKEALDALMGLPCKREESRDFLKDLINWMTGREY